MNLDSIKIELITWISKLNDQSSIEKLLQIKNGQNQKEEFERGIFGSGKHLIEYIADDFNEPIDRMIVS